jgi:hypothetical protein
MKSTSDKYIRQHFNTYEHLNDFGYRYGDYLNRCRACLAPVDNVDKYSQFCIPCAHMKYVEYIKMSVNRVNLMVSDLQESDIYYRHYFRYMINKNEYGPYIIEDMSTFKTYSVKELGNLLLFLEQEERKKAWNEIAQNLTQKQIDFLFLNGLKID